MTDKPKRLQDLPLATEVASGDYVLLSQGGVTKRVDAGLLTGSFVTTTLAGLSDVNTSGAANGALLAYNGSLWVSTNNTTNQIFDGGNF
jgi:hypothetical protein